MFSSSKRCSVRSSIVSLCARLGVSSALDGVAAGSVVAVVLLKLSFVKTVSPGLVVGTEESGLDVRRVRDVKRERCL